MKCRDHCEKCGKDSVARCVQRNVLQYPEAERQERINKCRAINEQGEADLLMFRLGCERGYHLACENLKSIMLLAADGTMKSLLHFGADDLVKWERQRANQAEAWQERNEWFQSAHRALEKAGVDTIAALPAETIQELAAAADRVWKKRREA
jgi:hypothetical protein